MEKMKPHFRNSQQGVAIVLLMIILIVATGIGIWGLTSSRSSLLRAGSRKYTTELTYQAEQGLQKAVRRFQTIAGNNDPAADANNADSTPGKTTTGNYNPKNIDFLVNTLCMETDCGSANPACPAFNAIKNFDAVDNNVVCNFLGVVDLNNQVSIVRKNDLTVGSGETFAIFLVNSIATDSSGRKQAIQGVVVVPYSGTSSTGTPYLASSKAVTD
ncbi:MAG: hypothetical protein R2877_00525 [Bdellovibrionota bacterium]